MISISLSDGKIKKYKSPVTGNQIAKDIAPSLFKKALAAQVDGEYKDLNVEIAKDSNVKIITMDDDYALELLRHDSAHCMAMAVQQLFPGTQVTIGPVIENGFYYDFARDEPFSDSDLEKIEKKMYEIIEQDPKTTREVWDRNKAIKHFKNLGEHYKAEIIDSIPKNEEVSIYFHGPWHDLCRGPHLPSLGKIGKAFKLTKVAGAYWRGDSNNKMLQRIYGTCWKTKKDLDDYLHRIEEAEKRDHRKIGKALDLFHFQEESPGAVFWHQKGWSLFQSLVKFMREKQNDAGYLEVNTPEMLDKTLWEKSGHWDKFQEYMYTTDADKKTFAIKPMNCPGHVQVFNQGLKSYKDLPIKISEFGLVHRNEPSGTLHGLMRARQFVQDDAHIFCSENQLSEEIKNLIKMTFSVYKHFGFENISIALSTRPEKRVGDENLWDKSENILKKVLSENVDSFSIQDGEGAFYGPKIEFSLTDSLDRVWQCGTIQLDFSMPSALAATYVDESGNKMTPVMIHRAILGSIERFIGILIEHYGGNLPFWLSPEQIMIVNITDKHVEFAEKIEKVFKDNGFRCTSDLRNQKIGYKIREHIIAKIPYVVIIGDEEVSSNNISVREYDGTEHKLISVSEFIAELSSKK